ncbi:uncharacterized protein LOC130644709 isoform X1 [Hydractinia symbiolongicarpus]|uniref:uncharacterized protein LOC130644709 isoform X1 n=1 Tax=Hydractinia symbiolongicarpus TaxID=13093 RepID=UPI00254DCA88|nr:uncharacterized protein LOC130644709 isoform X1 [Hydractinia symbiolongicarpus]
MILTIENINSLSTNVKNYVITVYSIAMLCEFVTTCIYMLNMKQLSASETLINHPLRRTRAIIIISCCVVLMLWRALVIIRITYQKSIKEDNITESLLSVTILLVNMVCYFLFLSLYILFLYITIYLPAAANKRWQFYFTAYACPILFTLVIILIGYLTHRTHFSWNNVLSNEWIIIAIQGIVVALGASISVFVLKIHLKLFGKCEFDFKTKIKRLRESKKLVNGFILGIILLVLFILDVIHISTECSVVQWLFVTFHALLGVHFLFREAIFYDKDFFQKTSRAQRRRKAIKENQFIQLRSVESSSVVTQAASTTVDKN